MDVDLLITAARRELGLVPPHARTLRAWPGTQVSPTVASDDISAKVTRLGQRARHAVQVLAGAASGAIELGSPRPGGTAAALQARLQAVAGQMMVEGARLGHEFLPRGVRTTNNRVGLLVGNAGYLPGLYADLERARDSITIVQYNWEPDGSGLRVADILKRKVRQGVKVRVLIDALGGNEAGFFRQRAFFDDMKAAGIDIKRVWPKGTGAYRHAFEHRKVIDIDHQVGYLGGLGFGAKYDTWTDLMVRMEGPAVASSGAQVLGLWTDRGGAIPDSSLVALRRGMEGLGRRLDARPSNLREMRSGQSVPGGVGQGLHGVQVLENRPGVDLAATEAYLRDARQARKRLWATSQYMTSELAAAPLRDAARRGVDVRLIVPGYSSGQNRRFLHLSRTFYPDLIKAGVKIYELPTMIHAKSWMADDAVSVGSMNLSHASMAVARENIARIDGRGIRSQYEHFYRTTMKRSRRLDADELRGQRLQLLTRLRKAAGVKF